MDAPHPLLDLWIWLRFVAGILFVVILPGHLLVGRFLGPARGPTRLLHSLAGGLLLVPLLGWALSWTGWLHALYYVPAAVTLALALGRWERWRELWTHLMPSRPPVPLAGRLALLASVAFMGWIVIPHWGELTAPLGDAANHAFLTWRIDQTGSLLPSRIFAPPYTTPGFTYFAGWHASAAMIAQVSGVAPWVVTWLLPVTLVVLLPLVFWSLWENCGLDARTASLAALLMGAFHFFPVGVFSWSGLGIFVGWFLVPFLVAALTVVPRSGTVLAGITAGLGAVALMTIHAAELFLVVVFGAVALAANSPALPEGRDTPWRAWAALILVIVLGLGLAAAVAGPDYGSFHRNPAEIGHYVEKVRFGMEAESPGWNLLRFLIAPGLVLGLLSRRLRWFSAAGLVLVMLYFWLLTSNDPVVMSITRPFYRQPPRLRYTFCLIFPVWIALTLTWTWARFGALTGGRFSAWRTAAGMVLLGVLLHDAADFPSKFLRRLDRFESFGPADLEQARRFGASLPSDALVANLRYDGSHWAMHASGAQFLRPGTWPFRGPEEASRTRAVLDLAADPWSPAALRLRDLGVTHLYVSDTYESQNFRLPDDSDFDRDHFRADPRFESVDEGENASLFVIDWDS